MNAHIPLAVREVKKLTDQQLIDSLIHFAGERREFAGDYNTTIERIRAELLARLKDT